MEIESIINVKELYPDSHCEELSLNDAQNQNLVEALN